MSNERSSSVVNPSDLTPLHSNNTKSSLVGSNVYKVSTMENSIKKLYKKSLNLSSNQYNEQPTTTDWHSSLVNQEDNLEEIHYYFVMFYQKKKRLLEKLENISRLANNQKSSKKGKNRATSAKRRRKGDSNDKPYNSLGKGTDQYEFIKQKNSNVEL